MTVKEPKKKECMDEGELVSKRLRVDFKERWRNIFEGMMNLGCLDTSLDTQP